MVEATSASTNTSVVGEQVVYAGHENDPVQDFALRALGA